MKFILLTLFLFSTLANSAVYTRQHSDTIVEGKKILASDLNDEFDAIAASVNAVDSGNITDGSILTEDHAATSSATFNSRKRGCNLSTVEATPSIMQINPPCEIFHNGRRGEISATREITVLNNFGDTAVLATGTVYYIYGTATASADISFRFSLNPPLVSTSSERNDPVQRYIGSAVSESALGGGGSQVDFIDMVTVGNRVILDPIDESESMWDPQPISTSEQTKYWKAPEFVRQLVFSYEVNPGSSTGSCLVSFNTAARQIVEWNSISSIFGELHIQPYVNIGDKNVKRSVSYSSISNCNGINLGVKGWYEPLSLHQ